MAGFRATRLHRVTPLHVVRAQRGLREPLPLGLERLHEIRARWDREAAIVEVATAQYGAVARWQLRALALSDDEVDQRLGSARLQGVFHGVHLLGHLAAHALALPCAALLAAGPGAVLSHFTAAWLHGFAPEPAAVDVLAPVHRRHQEGLRVHGGPAVAAVRMHGLPATDPARTAVDVAALTAPGDVERLLDQALVHATTTPDLVLDAVRPGQRNARQIREALGVSVAGSKSRAEARLRRLIKRAGLPEPDGNVMVAGHECDLVWRSHRLVAEYDSWRYHRTPLRFAADRRRNNDVQAAGFGIFRYTDADVGRPEATAVALALELRRREPQ